MAGRRVVAGGRGERSVAYFFTVGVGVALVALVASLAAPAAAQPAYPERPLRMIVPFPAGGTVDSVARVLAQKAGELLGHPVVVENRAGAAGAIGSAAVAQAAPDGYTILFGTASTHGTNPAVQKALPYDAQRSFAPVALVGSMPYLLVVNPSVPASSTAELLALVRSQPGKLHYGSYGPGSSNHLATELFRALTGADIVHVPYKGGAPALAALVAGEVQMMFDVYATSAPYLKSGRLRAIAVAAEKRSPFLPDVPTFREAGVKDMLAGTFFGVFAPAGTPGPVVGRLNDAIDRAIATPELRERFSALGVEPGGGSPERLKQAVDTEVALWTRLVRERNLRFEN